MARGFEQDGVPFDDNLAVNDTIAPIEHRKIADSLCDIANDLSDDWKDEKRVMRQAVEALRSRIPCSPDSPELSEVTVRRLRDEWDRRMRDELPTAEDVKGILPHSPPDNGDSQEPFDTCWKAGFDAGWSAAIEEAAVVADDIPDAIRALEPKQLPSRERP